MLWEACKPMHGGKPGTQQSGRVWGATYHLNLTDLGFGRGREGNVRVAQKRVRLANALRPNSRSKDSVASASVGVMSTLPNVITTTELTGPRITRLHRLPYKLNPRPGVGVLSVSTPEGWVSAPPPHTEKGLRGAGSVNFQLSWNPRLPVLGWWSHRKVRTLPSDRKRAGGCCTALEEYWHHSASMCALS